MTDMESLQKDIGEIKTTVRDIYKVLNGNGKIGLVTQAALNKSAITRAWWWLGGIYMAVLSVATYVIRCGIRP
jgi:hypothetical protein